MAITRILIAVKTYPTLSTKYDELVCTAGFREDGTWIRLYPVPFRKKPYQEQYKKYDWIEVDIEKNKSDFRPESFRPVNLDKEINIVGHIGTNHEWEERKKIVLMKVYHDLTALKKEAKNKKTCTSLAVFKPKVVTDFLIKKTDRNWKQNRINKLKQLNLYESVESASKKVIRKLPYKFSFVFEDSKGVKSTMMIEDWEIGQLYWKMFDKYQNEEIACRKVKEKYFDDFAKTKNLYLFLGTTRRHHFVAPNPFMIIGTFHPKHKTQLDLFSK